MLFLKLASDVLFLRIEFSCGKFRVNLSVKRSEWIGLYLWWASKLKISSFYVERCCMQHEFCQPKRPICSLAYLLEKSEQKEEIVLFSFLTRPCVCGRVSLVENIWMPETIWQDLEWNRKWVNWFPLSECRIPCRTNSPIRSWQTVTCAANLSRPNNCSLHVLGETVSKH